MTNRKQTPACWRFICTRSVTTVLAFCKCIWNRTNQQWCCCTLTPVSPPDQFHYTVHHFAGTLIVALELLTEHNFPLKESQRNEQREKLYWGPLTVSATLRLSGTLQSTLTACLSGSSQQTDVFHCVSTGTGRNDCNFKNAGRTKRRGTITLQC